MNQEIIINLYCDEIKDEKINDPYFDNQCWDYFGFLLVPANEENELISRLLKCRCANPNNKSGWNECDVKCKYHNNNNKEVHYKDLQSFDKFHIASRWFDFFENDTNLTRFYIVGVNNSALDSYRFGNGTKAARKEMIYNRFFRTALLKSTKSYFHMYNKIIIRSIVHDKSNFQKGDFFPWHVIFRVEKDDQKVSFECNEIEFIDSNHNVTNDDRSNLIQYIDLLLGATFNALHYKSKNINKVTVSRRIAPFLRLIMEQNFHRLKKNHLLGRMDIDFFPKCNNLSKFDESSISYDLGCFYKSRVLRVEQADQTDLFQ